MTAVPLEVHTDQESVADITELGISVAAMLAATRVVSATAVGMV